MSRGIFCTLQDFLRRYEWNYQSYSDDIIRTGWCSDGRSFSLEIEVSPTWVSFRVDPLIDITIDWDSWPELSQFLMELNDRCSMVRLSLGTSEQIVVTLDIFVDQLSYDTFAQSLSLIGYYSEQFYSEFLEKLDQIGLRYNDSLNFLA